MDLRLLVSVLAAFQDIGKNGDVPAWFMNSPEWVQWSIIALLAVGLLFMCWLAAKGYIDKNWSN